nr:hypothetical protein [Lachnospiraceae bacterium]
MKMKKLIAVGLSLAMTIGSLAGCGGQAAAPAPAADATAPADDTAAAPADDTAAAPADDSAAADSGEVQEITFMVWDDLEASEDLITKGYKQSVDRFN